MKHSGKAKARKERFFFFEKKKQKTFTLALWLPWSPCAEPNRQKFFGSFFKKRTLLPMLALYRLFMSVALRVPGMTREDFFLLAEAQHGRFEFDGFEPVAMTVCTLNHSLICQNLWAALRSRLFGSTYTLFGPDAGLATGDNAVRYPDALVTAGPVDGNARLAPDVVLVFEVLSPTSGRTDRIEKPGAYFGVPSIRRYVIVEYEFVGLTVLERDATGAAWKATTLGTGDTLRLPDLGIEIPLTEFYQDVDLPLPEPSAGG